MTVNIPNIDINNDKWVDLIARSNDVINAYSKTLSTTSPLVGDVHIIGTVRARKIYENSRELVHSSRRIYAGEGLVGGGILNNDISLSLSSNTHASLAKANTALQPASISGLVPNNRRIYAGEGLTGGGILNNDISLSLSSNTHASLVKANTALQPDNVTGGWEIGDVSNALVSPSDEDKWLVCNGDTQYLRTAYPELEGMMLNAPVYNDAWDITKTVYSTKFISVNAQDGTPFGIFFNPDGTKMYLLGNNSKRIFQYNLSIRWDISTAVLSTQSTTLTLTTAQEIFFKPDGRKVYIINRTGNSASSIYEYDLTTPWDITTISSTPSNTLAVGAQDVNPYGISFKPDGSKMFIVGINNDSVYEYNLSTPWSVITATYSGNFIGVGSQNGTPVGISFSQDGTKMYMLGQTFPGNVYEYNLSTPWSVITATYSVKLFPVNSQDSAPYGIFFKPDGTKMYMVGFTNKGVFEYNIGTTTESNTHFITPYLNNDHSTNFIKAKL